MAADSITFIGGGNMARSLIAGLIRQGVPAAHIHVAEPVAALRESLAADFGVQVHDNAIDAAAQGGTWLLAVKPQVLREVCQSLQALAQANRPLVVSIAAGITSAQLERWLGGNLPVVRAMPNTPALLGAGVTGLYATPSVDAQQHAQAEQVLASAGRTVWIDREALMDSVTPCPAADRPMCSCWPKRWKRRVSPRACPPTPHARWWCRPCWAPRGCWLKPAKARPSFVAA